MDEINKNATADVCVEKNDVPPEESLVGIERTVRALTEDKECMRRFSLRNPSSFPRNAMFKKREICESGRKIPDLEWQMRWRRRE